jgi:hypothetical protein
MAEVITKIISDKQYIPQIEVTEDFIQNFDRNLPSCLRHGFCSLVEFAQPDKIKEFAGFIPDFIGMSHKKRLEISTIEHILPLNWEQNDYYSEWNKETATSIINTIGNIALLEKPLIIDKINKTLIDKASYYSRSVFREPYQLFRQTLNKINNKEYYWLYNHYLERQNNCKKTLREFFEGKYI